MNTITCAPCLVPLPPNASSRSFPRNVSEFIFSVKTFSNPLEQMVSHTVQLGHCLFFLGRHPPLLGAICTCTRFACVLGRISDGLVPLVFLSGSRFPPQLIGKTTNKILSGDMTTTFPALVVSTSDYNTENVRRNRATLRGASVHAREPRPWFDPVLALFAAAAVLAYCSANRLALAPAQKSTRRRWTLISFSFSALGGSSSLLLTVDCTACVEDFLDPNAGQLSTIDLDMCGAARKIQRCATRLYVPVTKSRYVRFSRAVIDVLLEAIILQP